MIFLRTSVDLRQLAHRAEHLSHEPICAAERGVDARADADEPAGDGVLE